MFLKQLQNRFQSPRNGASRFRRFRPSSLRLEDRTVPASLAYSTFLGGSSSEEAFAVAADPAGNTYVTGSTTSANFPATAGAFDASLNGLYDAFVAKVRPDGTLAWATYLGGNGDERGHGIAVDAAGGVYVTGRTDSTNFPTTAGSLDNTFNGGVDAFVTKLNADGTMAYSTYLGGTGFEIDQAYDKLFRRVGAIAVDAAGNAYVTGSTTSADFPTTGGALSTVNAGFTDVFVSKLNAAGSALVYSTYLGGSDFDRGHGIAVDTGGNAYVSGEVVSTDFPTTAGVFQPTKAGGYNDMFVTKLNASGSNLVYSSYLGGLGSDLLGGGRLALDSAGQAYVTGTTDSFNFPTTAGAFQPGKAGFFDAFVTKVNATGSGLVYSTYLGGADSNDYGEAIAVNSSGEAYVTGETDSIQFPAANAFQPQFTTASNAFITKFNVTGSALVYSSHLGGGADEVGYGIAVDANQTAHLVGKTNSNGATPTWPPFAITANAFQPAYGGGGDAFVVKVVDGTLPRPQVASVIVGDGMAQRSRVTSVSVTFNSVVTFAGSVAGAFQLRRQSDNALVGLSVSVVDGTNTKATLTFTGGPIESASLADGRYTLTVLASHVNGGNFDGNGDGIAGDDYVLTSSGTTGVFRLFGDATGDGTVAANDFILFRQSFGGVNSIFDFDGDGFIAASDFIQFRLRFGGSI